MLGIVLLSISGNMGKNNVAMKLSTRRICSCCTTFVYNTAHYLSMLIFSSNVFISTCPFTGTTNYAATAEDGVDLPTYANRSSGGRLLDTNQSNDVNTTTTHNRIHNMSTDSESRV